MRGSDRNGTSEKENEVGMNDDWQTAEGGTLGREDRREKGGRAER